MYLFEQTTATGNLYHLFLQCVMSHEFFKVCDIKGIVLYPSISLSSFVLYCYCHGCVLLKDYYV